MRLHRHLLQNFVSPIQTTYSLGKTEFRDLLYDKLGCSLDEAEKLVDALEEMNKIEFQRTQKGSRYGFWIIHCDSEDGVS